MKVYKITIKIDARTNKEMNVAAENIFQACGRVHQIVENDFEIIKCEPISGTRATRGFLDNEWQDLNTEIRSNNSG